MNAPPTTPGTRHPAAPDDAAEAAAEALADAWSRGDRVPAEEVLGRFPGLDDAGRVRVVFEEICLRQEAGEEGVSGEVLARFPADREALAVLLDCNRLLAAPAAPAPEFPGRGEDLGGCRVVAELGRGAVGRTYLARQPELADRLVVLKATPAGAPGPSEHLSLARLPHMHIVPLFFEQEVPARGLRVLGMPYLGGATLADLLASLRDVAPPARTGAGLLAALDRAGSELPAVAPASGPVRAYLARATYAEAVAWLGACLADALQYAHDRGLVHLDVKPANVLVTADAQPMLLDFHLARPPLRAGDPPPDRLGGTPGYLAPEQVAAMAAVRAGRPVPAAVDGRADVYALSLLLEEALAGGPPAPGGPTLDRRNPRVSPGLADVIARGRAECPAARYPSASALADDLRRHLADQPLRGVAHRSVAETWRKWRRRRPAALARGLVWTGVLAAAVGASLAALNSWRRQNDEARAALLEGAALLERGRSAEAVAVFDRGLDRASGPFAPAALADDLRAGYQTALRDRAADQLHEVVELLRFRLGFEPPPAPVAAAAAGAPAKAPAPAAAGAPAADAPRGAAGLVDRGREAWARRGALLKPAAGVPPLPPDRAARARTDLLDLATIWADLRRRLAPAADRAEARREALEVLREARRELGGSPSIDRDLRDLEGGGDAAADPPAAPSTAWEHYDLGRWHLRNARYGRAAGEFRRAVALRPGEFWSYFGLAASAARLGRPREALHALDVCVALAPTTAACYANRALVHDALGDFASASADRARARELQAESAPPPPR